MKPVTVSQGTAHQAKSRYRFQKGVGYVHVGKLRQPQEARFPVERCLPPSDAVAGTWHVIRNDGHEEQMQWQPAEKEWAPQLGRGRRLAFPAAYLAAHGWVYARAVTRVDG